MLSLCGCPAREKRELLDSWRLGINENLFVPYIYVLSSIASLNPVFQPLLLKVVSRAPQDTAIRWEGNLSFAQLTSYYKNMKRPNKLVHVLTL